MIDQDNTDDRPSLEAELDGLLSGTDAPQAAPWSTVNMDALTPPAAPEVSSPTSVSEKDISNALSATSLQAATQKIKDQIKQDRFKNSVLGTPDPMAPEDRASLLAGKQAALDFRRTGTVSPDLSTIDQMSTRASNNVTGYSPSALELGYGALTGDYSGIIENYADQSRERKKAADSEQAAIDFARQNPDVPIAGWLRDKADRAVSGVVGTAADSVLRGVGLGVEIGQWAIGAKDDIVGDQTIREIGNYAKAKTEQLFPADPVRAGEFSSDVASGLASTIVFAGGGASAKVLGGLAKLSNPATERLVFATVAGLGAMANAAQVTDEALQARDQRTVTNQQIAAAYVLASIIGTAEAAPIVFNIPGMTPLAKTRVAAMFSDIAREGLLEEGPQEGLNQLANNAVAKYFVGYDPDRNIMDGVYENAAIGMISGGVVRGAGLALSRHEREQIYQEAALRLQQSQQQSPQSAQPATPSAPAKPASKATPFVVDLGGEDQNAGPKPQPLQPVSAEPQLGIAASAVPVAGREQPASAVVEQNLQQAAFAPPSTAELFDAFLPENEEGQPDTALLYAIVDQISGGKKTSYNQLTDPEKQQVVLGILQHEVEVGRASQEDLASYAAMLGQGAPVAGGNEPAAPTPATAQSAPVGPSGAQPATGGVQVAQGLPQAAAAQPSSAPAQTQQSPAGVQPQLSPEEIAKLPPEQQAAVMQQAAASLPADATIPDRVEAAAAVAPPNSPAAALAQSARQLATLPPALIPEPLKAKAQKLYDDGVPASQWPADALIAGDRLGLVRSDREGTPVRSVPVGPETEPMDAGKLADVRQERIRETVSKAGGELKPSRYGSVADGDPVQIRALVDHLIEMDEAALKSQYGSVVRLATARNKEQAVARIATTLIAADLENQDARLSDSARNLIDQTVEDAFRNEPVTKTLVHAKVEEVATAVVDEVIRVANKFDAGAVAQLAQSATDPSAVAESVIPQMTLDGRIERYLGRMYAGTDVGKPKMSHAEMAADFIRQLIARGNNIDPKLAKEAIDRVLKKQGVHAEPKTIDEIVEDVKPAESVVLIKPNPVFSTKFGPPKDKPVVLTFGGAFNPIHEGHVNAILSAVKMMEDAGYTVQKAVVVPTPQQRIAAKHGGRGFPLAERVEMSRVAFAKYPNIEVDGSPSEETAGRKGKISRTLLADIVQAKNPNASIVNISGEDVAPGNPPSVPSVYRGDKGTDFERYFYLVVPRDEESISSSKIRDMIVAGEKIPDDVVSQPVQDLYGRRPELLPKGAQGGIDPEVYPAADNFALPPPSRTLADNDPLLISRDQDNSPERVALRNRLIDQRFEGKRPADGKPVVYVMGGGAASGKGTVLRLLREAGVVTDDFVELDSDSFKTGDKAKGWDGIPEYGQILERGDDRAAGVTHKESSSIFKMAAERARTGRYNTVLDVTLGSPKAGVRVLKELRDSGYDVRMIGVTVGIETALRRAHLRSQGLERRVVDPRSVIRTHKGFSEGFAEYAKLADQTLLIDTNVIDGTNPILIASKQGASDLVVNDENAYISFVKKGSVNEQATTIGEIRASQGDPEAPRSFGGKLGRLLPLADPQKVGERAGRAGPLAGTERSQSPDSVPGGGLDGRGLNEDAGPVTPALSVSEPATLINTILATYSGNVSDEARKVAVTLETIGTDGGNFYDLKKKYLKGKPLSDLKAIAYAYTGKASFRAKKDAINAIEAEFIRRSQSEAERAILTGDRGAIARDREQRAAERRAAKRDRRLRESTRALSTAGIPETLQENGAGREARSGSPGNGGDGASALREALLGLPGEGSALESVVGGQDTGAPGRAGDGQRSGDEYRHPQTLAGPRAGSYVVKGGKLYRRDAKGKDKTVKIAAKDAARIKSLVSLRAALESLDGGSERINALRQAHDAFVAAHGPLTKTQSKTQKIKGKSVKVETYPNLAGFMNDPDVAALMALERPVGKGKVELVIPGRMDVSASEPVAVLGSPWVTADEYGAFLAHTVGAVGGNVAFDPQTGRWGYEGEHYFPLWAQSAYGTETMPVRDVVLAALNGDVIADKDAARKAKLLSDDFRVWAEDEPKRSDAFREAQGKYQALAKVLANETAPAPDKSAELEPQIQDFEKQVTDLKNRLGIVTQREKIAARDGGNTELSALVPPSEIEERRRELIEKVNSIQTGSCLNIVKAYVSGFINEANAVADVANHQAVDNISGMSAEQLNRLSESLQDLTEIINAQVERGYDIAEQVSDIQDRVYDDLQALSTRFDELTDQFDEMRDNLNEKIDEIEDAHPTEVDPEDESDTGSSLVSFDEAAWVQERDAREARLGLTPIERAYPAEWSFMDIARAETEAMAQRIRELKLAYDDVMKIKPESLNAEEAQKVKDRIDDLHDSIVHPMNFSRTLSTVAMDKSNEAYEILGDIHENTLGPALEKLEAVQSRIEDADSAAYRRLLELEGEGTELSALLPSSDQITSIFGALQSVGDDGSPFVGEKEARYQRDMRAFRLRQEILKELDDVLRQNGIAGPGLGSDPESGSLAEGITGAQGTDQESARRNVISERLQDPQFRSTVIDALVAEDLRQEAIDERAKAQGFVVEGYHAGSGALDKVDAFRRNGAFGFHISVGDPAGANARVGFATSLLDKIYQVITGRSQTEAAAVNPVRIRAQNMLRMPHITQLNYGHWHEPMAWLAATKHPFYDGPESLKRFIAGWIRNNPPIAKVPGFVDHRFSRAMSAELERLGYDGVIYQDTSQGIGRDSAFVWDSTRVRSAYDTFHPDAVGAEGLRASDDYLEQDLTDKLDALLSEEGMSGAKEAYSFGELSAIAGPVGPSLDSLGYYSKALEAAKALKQAKGTPEQMLAQLRTAGVKQSELDATKLASFLDGKKSVTRDEIVGYLEQNRVVLTEGRYGGENTQLGFPTREAGIAALKQAMGYDGPTVIKKVRSRLSGEFEDGVFKSSGGLLNRATEEEPIGTISEINGQVYVNPARGPALRPPMPKNVKGRAKWLSYSLDPSNPTYRETVLHLPGVPLSYEKWLIRSSWHDDTPESRAEYQRMVDAGQMTDPDKGFKSGHWSEPNIIAHARTQILKDTQNRSVFNIDELQSDWGQKLRDGGARDEEKIKELTKKRDSLKSVIEEMQKPNGSYDEMSQVPWGFDRPLRDDAVQMAKDYLRKTENVDPEEAYGYTDDKDYIQNLVTSLMLANAELQNAQTEGALGHPLVNTTDQWTTTALRKLIRQAVEAGADAISFTPGQVQAERFGLEHNIKQLDYKRNENGTYQLSYQNRQGRGTMLGRDIKAEELADYVGRDVADRITSGTGQKLNFAANNETPDVWTRLSGMDLTTGGEGMKATYDVMYPRTLGKILQKIDPSIKAGTSTVSAEKYSGDVISFPITDKVRQTVMSEGQAMFALKEQGNLRPTQEFNQSRDAIIADLTSRLRTMLPPDVSVRFSERLFSSQGGFEQFGRFKPEIRLIELALAYGPEKAIQIGAHEVVHVLRGAGAFTDAEWASLSERARKVTGDLGGNISAYRRYFEAQADLQRMPDALKRQFVERMVEEEMVARLAEMHFAPREPSRFGAAIDGLMQRMQDILDAIVSAFRGQGLNTPEDIFRRMEQGKIAERIAPKPAKTVSPPVRGKASDHAVIDAMWAAPDTPKPPMTIERPFKVRGYKGSVTATQTEDGTKTRIYRVIDEEGAEVARMAVAEREANRFEAIGLWIAKDKQGRGLGARLMQGVAADIGEPLMASGIIPKTVYDNLKLSDPDRVRFHVAGGAAFDGFYVPGSSIEMMRSAAKKAADRGDEGAFRDHAELKKLEARVPDQKFEADRVNDQFELAAMAGPPSSNLPQLGNMARSDLDTPERSLSDLVDMVNEALGSEVRMGRISPALKRQMAKLGYKVMGQFNKSTGITRIVLPNDLQTLAHEGGHRLEVNPVLKDQIEAIKQNAVCAAELVPLASPGKDQLSEGWAEFFRLFLIDPAEAKAKAPTAQAQFRVELEAKAPELLLAFEAIQAGYAKLLDASPAGAVLSRVQSAKQSTSDLGKLKDEITEKGWRGALSDWWYGAVKSTVNSKHPLKVARDLMLQMAQQNLGTTLAKGQQFFLKAINDPYKQARMLEHATMHATSMLKQGVVFKGKSMPQGPSLQDALTAAFGGSDKMLWSDEMAQTFGAYLVARRMNAEWDRFDLGYLENPPDNLIGRDKWRKAQNDFETAHPDFRKGARLLDQFVRNVLHWKWENGFLTDEQYEDFRLRDGYAPLNRVMDDTSVSSLRTGTAPANKRKVIYRFRGSTRDFINPLESIMADVYATTRRVELNNTIRALVKTAQSVGPDGGKIAELIPPNDMRAKGLDLRDTMDRIREEADKVLQDAISSGAIDRLDAETLRDELDTVFDERASQVVFSQVETSGKPGEHIVYLWENGKRKPVLLGSDQLGADIFEIMAGVGQAVQDEWWMNGAVMFTQAFRAGVTKSPAYIAVNWFRDQLATWALSRDFTPFWTGLKGLRDIAANTDAAQRYNAFAGMMGGIDAHLVDQASRGRDLTQLRQSGFLAAPTKWQSILRAMEVTEAASRIAHMDAAYKRLIADGFSEDEAAFEAAYNAHDVMDFSRRGSKMSQAARLVAFLNSQVQGLSAAIRTIKGERDAYVEVRDAISPFLKAAEGQVLSVGEKEALPNSTRIWFKLCSIGLIGLALALTYKDDPEYEELTKGAMGSTHWFAKINGVWWRFPKPFELAIFSNLFEAMFDRVVKGDPLAGERMMRSVRETMLISPEMQTFGALTTALDVVKTPLDTLSGKLQYDKSQEDLPVRLRGLPPEMQWDAYTSEFSKLLAGTFGVSPYKTDKLIRDLFASVGRDALTVSDYTLPYLNQATGGALPGVAMQPRADKSFEDYIFISRIARRVPRGAYSTWQFWQDMGQDNGRYTTAANGYKKELDELKSPRDAQRLLATLDDDRKAYVYLEYNYKEKDQDLHPLNRAKQVVSALSQVRRQMAEGTLYVEKTDKKGKDATRIDLPPSTQRVVNEVLEDIAMREARNAQIVLGKPGWAQAKELPTEGLWNELKAAAPDLYDEVQWRLTHGRYKVYPYEGVKAVWPQVKESLLRDPKAPLAQFRAQAKVPASFEAAP